jgi:hypothetical protein
MKNYTGQSRSLWTKYKLNPPPMFYGSSTGALRIYPGNPKNCGTVPPYDPRLRPWFVAASGPKSLMILNTECSNRDKILTVAVLP